MELHKDFDGQDFLIIVCLFVSIYYTYGSKDYTSLTIVINRYR